MQRPPELRLGSAVVSFLYGRRFVFKDVYDPTRVVTIDDADVADLLLFLHGWSKLAGERLEVVLRPEQSPP